MARSKQSKSKQMKIKQPSLKGMKNTSYLGHFAKDEFIQKGHNFSGRVTVSNLQGTPDIERFAVSNPFEAQAEFARRQQEVGKEMDVFKKQIADVEQLRNQRIADFQLQRPTSYSTVGAMSDYDRTMMARENALQQAIEAENLRTRSQVEGIQQQMESLRGRRKKFLEEL